MIRLPEATLLLGALWAGIGLAAPADIHPFARAPALTDVTLSPDGSRVAYIIQAGEHQAVMVRTLHDGSERRVLEVTMRRERVRWCGWPDARRLLCGTVLIKRRPDRVSETTRLYSMEADQGRARELTARLPDAVRDDVIDMHSSRPGHVLLQHDPVGLGHPEVSELDISTGALRRLVRSHPPVRRWISDGRGTVRLGIGYSGSNATLHVPDGDDWSLWLTQSLHDPAAVGPLAFGARAQDLYVLRHHEGRAALFSLTPGSSEQPRLLFAHSRYDVSGPLLLEPATGRLLGVRYVTDREEQHYFDAGAARLQREVDRFLPDSVNLIAAISDDGMQRLVLAASDTNPPSWYLHDVAAGAVTLIGHEYPELEARALAPMQALSYQARDGQSIRAYLTLPVERGVGPLPAVVFPHGGPETRTVQTFDPLVQFLAAQGYAVLQMNFRGSFGYGAGFAAAGAGHWGSVIHNDITDATRWLVDRELADPSRICIVGESFGGYAALLGAARESQWYACAASFAGISDLLALSQYAQRLQSAEVWNERLGTDSQALWQMSPITKIRAVESPVLLMHGRLDPVVPVSQSRRFARALRAAGKPHRYVERVECDHELTVESCRVEFFTELQHFLGQSLNP